MSSEVCQLCLEALTPLAEQCAKAQETDSPLFLATRHFLKVRCLGAVIARGGGGGLPSGGSAGTFIHEEIMPFCSLQFLEISFLGYVILHGYFVFLKFYMVNITWNLII